jgi:hypothetical protein
VPAPTLTSITPLSATRPAPGPFGVVTFKNVPVTLTGANLTGATAVTVSGTGVTVNTVVVVNSTQITANFVIASTATLGAHTVSVTTPGGTSNTVTFTVN